MLSAPEAQVAQVSQVHDPPSQIPPSQIPQQGTEDVAYASDYFVNQEGYNFSDIAADQESAPAGNTVQTQFQSPTNYNFGVVPSSQLQQGNYGNLVSTLPGQELASAGNTVQTQFQSPTNYNFGVMSSSQLQQANYGNLVSTLPGQQMYHFHHLGVNYAVPLPVHQSYHQIQQPVLPVPSMTLDPAQTVGTSAPTCPGRSGPLKTAPGQSKKLKRGCLMEEASSSSKTRKRGRPPASQLRIRSPASQDPAPVVPLRIQQSYHQIQQPAPPVPSMTLDPAQTVGTSAPTSLGLSGPLKAAPGQSKKLKRGCVAEEASGSSKTRKRGRQPASQLRIRSPASKDLVNSPSGSPSGSGQSDVYTSGTLLLLFRAFKKETVNSMDKHFLKFEKMVQSYEQQMERQIKGKGPLKRKK